MRCHQAIATFGQAIARWQITILQFSQGFDTCPLPNLYIQDPQALSISLYCCEEEEEGEEKSQKRIREEERKEERKKEGHCQASSSLSLKFLSLSLYIY